MSGWIILRSPGCKKQKDSGAHGCEESGRPGPGVPNSLSAKTTKSYLFVLLLIPAIILAGAFGYYKFVLPEGVAAIVDGEVISLAELDAAVTRTTSPGKGSADDGRIRYRVLDELIRERLIGNEALKAGISVTAVEFAAEVARLKAQFDSDQAAFNANMTALYGSETLFEAEVKREILIRKLLEQEAATHNSDLRRLDDTLSTWLNDLVAHATIRISLSEEWPESGVGCSRQDCPGNNVRAHRRGSPTSNGNNVSGRTADRH
jgi:hypothetical protein